MVQIQMVHLLLQIVVIQMVKHLLVHIVVIVKTKMRMKMMKMSLDHKHGR